jgi:hypothetical protein
MYPHERSLVKNLEGKRFALVGVNSDQDREALKKVLEAEKITWRSFWDGGGIQGPIATEWQVSGWPTLFILDDHGIIRYRYLGGPTEEMLKQTVEKLLAEVNPAKN